MNGADASLVERCRAIPSSTWSDALDAAGLTGVIDGLVLRAGSLPVAGSLVTVDERVGPLGSADPAQFGIDLILPATRPGDVVLIGQAGGPPASAIGGLAALAASHRGVAAIAIVGACRDVDELAAVGLPVLSATTTPASGRGRVRIAGVNVELRIGDVVVRPGDMLVADATGAVVLPTGRLSELLGLAEARLVTDRERAAELASGAQT